MASEHSIARTVGERLRTLRLQQGLTQRELARRVAGGVDLSYISRIERGEQLPSLKVLQRLGSALGASLKEFFDPLPVLSKKPDLPHHPLWRNLQKVPTEDLPILSAIIRVLARRRTGKTDYPASSLAGSLAAERKRRYRPARRTNS